MAIKMIILITKYKQHFELIKHIIECNTLEDCKNKLINYLVNEFCNLNIDFPDNLDDFEYIWFNYSYVKSNCFDYIIVPSETNEWNKPWELNDIYDDILEIIYNNDIANPPDFSKLYEEPTDD